MPTLQMPTVVIAGIIIGIITNIHGLLQNCPNSTCDQECEFGFSIGSDDCEICSCSGNPCENVICGKNAVCLIYKDTSNRYIGSCKNVCAQVTCENMCEFGYKNKNGCNTCDCLPDSCENVTCSFGSKCQPTGSLTSCIEIENPCLEVECRLECVTGSWNEIRTMNCTGCHCENPCLDIECYDKMCFIKKEKIVHKNSELSLNTGECQDHLRCRPLSCPATCKTTVTKDKYGCPTCNCQEPCDNITCPDGEYCRADPVTAQCTECPKLNCDDACLFGRVGCSRCQCLENPCLMAPVKPNMSCQPLFHPMHNKPPRRLVVTSQAYQDYIYIGIGEKGCRALKYRYLEYFGIVDSVNCDSEQNFKPLQCSDEGNCWCLRRDGSASRLVTEKLSIITCGFHSKEFFQLVLLSPFVLSEAAIARLKIDVAKQLAALISLDEQKATITNVTGTPAILQFVLFFSSENEATSALNLIKKISGSILTFKFVEKELNFTSPVKDTKSTTNKITLDVTTSTTTLKWTADKSSYNAYLLLTILLPILAVLVGAVVTVSVAFVVMVSLRKRRRPTPSISEEPIMPSKKHDVFYISSMSGSEV